MPCALTAASPAGGGRVCACDDAWCDGAVPLIREREQTSAMHEALPLPPCARPAVRVLQVAASQTVRPNREQGTSRGGKNVGKLTYGSHLGKIDTSQSFSFLFGKRTQQSDVNQQIQH